MKKAFKYLIFVMVETSVLNGIFWAAACAWFLLGLPDEGWALWAIFGVAAVVFFILHKLIELVPSEAKESLARKIFYDIDCVILQHFRENYYDYNLDNAIDQLKKKYLPGGGRDE